MRIELLELKHNLKDRDFDVNGLYKIDENEANKIVEAIEYEEQREKEMMNIDTQG